MGQVIKNKLKKKKKKKEEERMGYEVKNKIK